MFNPLDAETSGTHKTQNFAKRFAFGSDQFVERGNRRRQGLLFQHRTEHVMELLETAVQIHCENQLRTHPAHPGGFLKGAAHVSDVIIAVVRH